MYLDYITPREKSKGNTAYFGKDDLREIFRRIKEENRSHTLCMARFDDAESEKKIRKAPQMTLCGIAIRQHRSGAAGEMVTDDGETEYKLGIY